MRFTLDCFTENSVGTKFPENTYEVDTLDKLANVIYNCARKEAGIAQVQVWVDEPHDGEPIGDI